MNNKLRKLLSEKSFVRAIESSNGLSALIANTKGYDIHGAVKEFDALWVSSLCDSAFKGKPDIEVIDFSERLHTINEIMEVSSKPIILDCDTGGRTEHFAYHVRTLERLGVSAVIIEDKTGLKTNSLYTNSSVHELEDPTVFAEKIKAGKSALCSDSLMIFARIESLIADRGIQDALERAALYIKAGADGIMIHSKSSDGSEVQEFLKEFRKTEKSIPVCAAPTTYNHLSEEELNRWGINLIIHANYLMRSAYPAMVNTAQSILSCGRSLEAEEKYCMTIKDCLEIIPGGIKVE